jgi:predicted transcriptional regulator/predicted RNase H-like HicB family nuclease
VNTYTVPATRNDGWWVINADVPGAIVWSQARRLEQVEPMAREAIALTLDASPDSFIVNVVVEIPQEIRLQVDAAKRLAELSDEFQSLTAELRRQIATDLQKSGYTARDSGELIGISSQRISQMLAEHRHSGNPSSSLTELIDELTEQLQPAQDLLAEVSQSRRRELSADRG